jgi:hypothetical protein
MKTAKKRQPLSVDKYIYDLLCNAHTQPPARDSFEERRLNGSLTPEALLEERPVSEWIIMHPSVCAPAEVVVNYLFYIGYDHVRADACYLLLYVMTVVPATDRMVNDAYLREMQPTYQNPYPDVPIKLALFLELAHGPYGVAEMRNAIYACMDELMFSEGRIIPYSLQSIPDCTLLKSMTTVYETGPISNKREIHRKFRFIDDQNIDLMNALIKICYKVIGPKKATPKEYNKLLVRTCMIDVCVCEFVLKMLLVGMVDHRVASIQSSKVNGLAAVLFGPSFLCGGLKPADIIKARVDKYNLFNTPISKHEFLAALSVDNAPHILMLMKEAYRVSKHRPVPQGREPPLMIAGPAAPPPIPDFDLPGPEGLDGAESELDSDDEGSESDSSERADSVDGFGEQTIGGGSGILAEIIKKCEGINYSSYRESPSDAVPGKEYMMPDPNPLLPPADMEAMRKCLSPYASITDEAYWLVCFGVPIPDIVCMHRMIYHNSSAIKTYLFDLYTNHRPIYAVFFTYFSLLNENAIHYEVDGDLDMWVKHTQAAAAHYHLKEGEEIPIVVGRVLACDNCRDIKHPSFYFRLVKAQINGTGKILTTATCLFCAKEPKAGFWQDQYIIDHNERAPGALMTLCGPSKFMIGAPRENEWLAPSLVYRRKFGKFISTQIKLHKCAEQELRVLTILGRFTVYDGVIYTGCYGCLRFSQLEDLIYYGEDVLCEDCVQDRLADIVRRSMMTTTTKLLKGADPGNALAPKEGGTMTKTKAKPARIMCAYCNRDITALHKKGLEGGSASSTAPGTRSFFLFADNMLKPEFREVHFCSTHNNLRWVTQYEVPLLSVVLRGIKSRWGMRDADGNMIPVGPLRGEAGFRFAKSVL